MALTLLRSFDTDEIFGWSPVRFAEETEHWEAVELILIEGASTSDLAVTKRKLQESERAARIFGELCRRRLVRLLSFALEQSPCLVQAGLPLNRSPLHEAARSGCPATVRCLVTAGAAVNAADDHGMMPLHEAAAHSNDYAVRILVDAGAVFDATDNGGRTALHYAARSGSAACIQLLLAKGASVDAVSADGCTALHEAATSPSAHVVRLLLDAGANKDAKSASGWTALHWAASRGRLYAVLILLEVGVSVDVKTVDDETPLHLAAAHTSPDVWEALVGAGADEGALDKKGWTPKERAADKSGATVAGHDTGGMNTSDASPEQSHVPPGTASDSVLRSNNNVCDSGDLSTQNSSVPLSSVRLNSTTQQAITEPQDRETVVGSVSAVSGHTASNEGSSLSEVSINNVRVSEELSAENSTVSFSNVSVNSTEQQTSADSQDDDDRNGECMSVVSGQRTNSESSSLYDEYSELHDGTGSAYETESGEQTDITDEMDSDEQTTSDDEIDSGDETDSDLYEGDEPEYASISSTNEEIDKFSERGSVDEPFSPVLTKNTVLHYEGPPLFPTLGTVGTSSKYNQQETKFHPKFRGRGRGAPRGSRGNTTAYTTRPVASVPRNEKDTESSQSQGRGRGGRSRRANFNGFISQQARRQGDVSHGQPNTVPSRGRSLPPYAREQPSTRVDYRQMEPQTSAGQKIRKTKGSSSLSQKQGGSNLEHKKNRRPDSQRGEGQHGSRHGDGQHRSKHGDGQHRSKHGDGQHGSKHGDGQHGSKHGDGQHGSKHGDGQHGSKHGDGQHGSKHGAGHHGSRHGGGSHGKGGHGSGHGEGHHGSRPNEGHHGSRHSEGHHGNRHGESHPGSQHSGAHRGNSHNAHHQWHGEGRGGNSHGRSRGGKN